MNVHRVLCDYGTTVNVMSYDAYQKIGLHKKNFLPTINNGYGFTGDATQVKGTAKLVVKFMTSRWWIKV